MPKRLISKGSRLLWILLLISLVLANAGISLRMENEAKNQIVLTTVDYKEFAKTADTANMNMDSVLSRLKAAGVHTVALNEVTLRDLAYRGDLYIASFGELSAQTRAMQPEIWQAIQQAAGSNYIAPTNLAAVTTDPVVAKFLDERLGARFLPHELIRFSTEDQYFFIINAQLNPINVENYLASATKQVSKDLDARLGFDQTLITRLQAQGFDIILRPGSNTGSNTAYQAEIAKMVTQNRIKYLIFAGNDLPGHPDQLGWLEDMVRDNRLIMGIIEPSAQLGFVSQKGLEQVMAATSYPINRVYSTTNDEFVTSVDERYYRWVRGVIDRSIRIVYIVPFKDQKLSYAQNLNNTLEITTRFQATMLDKGYVMDKPLNDLSGAIPGATHRFLVALSLFLAGTIYLLYLFRPRLQPAWLSAWLVLGLAAAVIGNLVLSIDLTKMYALGAAILYPVLSSLVLLMYLKANRHRTWLEQCLVSLAIILGINALGMYTVVTSMADLRYNMNVFYFSGVKLSFLAPLALFPVNYVSVMVGWADFKAKATRFLLAHPNYLVLVLLLVGGAGGYYYLGRTGNAVVAVSGLELRLREILESIFLARPRFKEFIIGYPALMVMVYWYRRFRLDLILLVLGFGVMMGSISMVNSFCHDFTAVMVSVNRTLAGLLCGVLVGLGAMVAIKLGEWLFAKLTA